MSIESLYRHVSISHSKGGPEEEIPLLLLPSKVTSIMPWISSACVKTEPGPWSCWPELLGMGALQSHLPYWADWLKTQTGIWGHYSVGLNSPSKGKTQNKPKQPNPSKGILPCSDLSVNEWAVIMSTIPLFLVVVLQKGVTKPDVCL